MDTTTPLLTVQLEDYQRLRGFFEVEGAKFEILVSTKRDKESFLAKIQVVRENEGQRVTLLNEEKRKPSNYRPYLGADVDLLAEIGSLPLTVNERAALILVLKKVMNLLNQREAVLPGVEIYENGIRAKA